MAFIGYWLSGAEGARPIEPAALFGAGATLRRIATGSRTHFTELNQAIQRHRLRPVIGQVFPFGKVPDAFRYLESGGGFGKLIISHG